jgi:hypothetical protein
MSLPIACSLGVDDLEGRGRQWSEVFAHATNRSSIAGGLLVTFPGEAELSAALADLIAKETNCCPWMAMDLAQGPDAISLRITSSDPMGERQIEAWFGG